LFAKANGKIQTFFYPLVVFGQAPLFFYIVHLFLYAGLVCGWRRRAPASRPCIHTGCWACYGRLKHRPPVNTVLRYL
jgi:hypothetical protein